MTVTHTLGESGAICGRALPADHCYTVSPLAHPTCPECATVLADQSEKGRKRRACRVWWEKRGARRPVPNPARARLAYLRAKKGIV